MALHARFNRIACFAPILLALSLSACDISGIGDGNKLESLEIARLRVNQADFNDNKVYRCFRHQLQLVGVFSDGQRGDYSARGRWTSSNPARIRVSNGDIQLPDNPELAYASGTLLPVSEGTATITGEFVGLTATYDVEVRSPTSFSISPASLSVAPKTASAISVRTVIDGYDLNVTDLAAWSFATPNAEVATIGSATGVVVGVAAGPELTARAQFPLCEGFAPAQGLTATVNVRPLTGLTLTREFSSAPNDELINGTTDALKTVATFAGTSETQDVTGQVTYTSDKPTIAAPGLLGQRNLVSGLAVGTAVLTSTYKESDATAEISSNPVMLTVVDDTLDTLSVSPEVATITALSTQQFSATGHYLSGRSQRITRHVTWSSGDTAKVLIGNGATAAGLAVSQLPEATTSAIKITGKLVIGTGDTAVTKTVEALLCTVLPGTVAGSCEAAPTP